MANDQPRRRASKTCVPTRERGNEVIERGNETVRKAAPACAALVMAVVAAAIPAVAAEPADDAENLFYLAADRLIVVRLHVRVDGNSFQEAWNGYVDKVLADLDQDGDKVLSAGEAQRLPSRNMLMSAGVLPRQNNNRAATADRNRDGKVTREEIAAYFRKIGLSPFQTSVSTQQPRQQRVRSSRRRQQPATDIFSHLDADEDGRLSEEEFASAVKSLHKLDLDDDGTISADELRPLQNPYQQVQVRSGQAQTDNQQPSFTTLSAAGSPRGLVQQLLTRYDKATAAVGAGADSETPQKDNRLSAEEIGLSPESFTASDVDDDGFLDFTELSQFVRRPPAQLEVTVRIGKREPQQPIVDLHSAGRDLQPTLRTSSAGTAAVMLGKTQIEFRVDPSSAAWGNAAAGHKQLFKQADRDNNAYLEQDEARRFSNLRNSFSLMDADGDGKVFEEEFLSFFSAVDAAARSRTVLNIGSAGRNLFEILDLNRDRRIGPREFKVATGSLELWDADGDRLVAKEELPTHVRLTFGRGRAGSASGAVRFVSPGGGAGRTVTAVGPAWFQKMDRNGDGDVARREFIGSRKEFDRLDADQDGLLDAGEAER